MTFHFMCVNIIFSSVSVGELLLTQLTIFNFTICNISYFPFWF